jgi:hypothetical protein
LVMRNSPLTITQAQNEDIWKCSALRSPYVPIIPHQRATNDSVFPHRTHRRMQLRTRRECLPKAKLTCSTHFLMRVHFSISQAAYEWFPADKCRPPTKTINTAWQSHSFQTLVEFTAKEQAF